ncbi:MAG: hypothetical protein ABI456_03485 [Ktedonobacteraceae bacterium]
MDNLSSHQSQTSSWQSDELPEDLQVVARRYKDQPVFRPSSPATEQLMQRLLTQAAFIPQETQQEERSNLWRIFVVARWRVFLLGPWLWITGVLLLLGLGSALQLSQRLSPTKAAGTSISATGPAMLILFLIILLPLSALLSLAHALRTPSPGLRAIEASCPCSYLQTTMGLALAVLAFDCLLGVLATLGIALAHWAPFWNLLLAWLAPLLLLTAISLPLALLRSIRMAMLVGGLPWLLLGISALVEQNAHNMATWPFSLPQDTLALSAHLAVIALSLWFLIVLFLSAPKWQRFCTL